MFIPFLPFLPSDTRLISPSLCSHVHTEALCHITNKFASAGTRIGRQVSRRGYYANDYWNQLLPWTQDKWDKAKYHVSGTAMSAEYGWQAYPTVYGRSMNIIRKMKLDFDALLEQYGATVMPTVTQAPRRHVAPDAGPLAWAKATRVSFPSFPTSSPTFSSLS